eukprot:00200.XXX_1620_1886_1 [CDS] Oithona nana genome sequencing.
MFPGMVRMGFLHGLVVGSPSQFIFEEFQVSSFALFIAVNHLFFHAAVMRRKELFGQQRRLVVVPWGTTDRITDIVARPSVNAGSAGTT